MKKGQIYEGIIERVDFPNKAVIPVEETTEKGEKIIQNATVKGGIPGQKISFSVKKARKEKCQGRLREILEKSPLETEIPPCPKYGICGGCNYQSLPYVKQLELKKEQVLRLVAPIYEERFAEKQSGTDKIANPGTHFIYDGIFGSPDIFGYRNKMEFSFGDDVKDGPLTLGLHKKGSFHDILDADCCKIVHEDFTKVLTCVRDYCQEQKIPHYRKNSHQGVLRHLLVRRSSSTGELLTALVVSSQQEIDWIPLSHRLQSLPLEGTLTGFLLITNDSLGDVVQSDRTEILYGRDWIMEEVLELKFRISAFSFFQTNTHGAEVLYSQARKYILDSHTTGKESKTVAESILQENLTNMSTQQINQFHDKTVFDLYSGTGTIAQLIAPVAKKVIGVEIVAEAVEAARENATLNGLSNCEFIAGDVLKVLDEIKDKPDFIILDPPRDGIHPKALKKIIDYGVENMVYISCKPTSLARDLAVLEANGYHMERMCNVDMFPQTVHVETVCLLSKLNTKQHVEVEIKMDELDLTAVESKATYEEIKAYVLEHSGMKVSSLYIAQVKQKCGIIERENYNKPKSEDTKQPQCPPEKEKAIMEALRHFGMI